MPDSNGTETVSPWRWEHLTPAQQQKVWPQFVAWVESLQRTYKTWVRLPACWSRHAELVNEIRLFWYWDMMLETGGQPDDAIRWHNELRHSAEAWRRLANCDHEEPTPIDVEIAQRREQDVRHHVDLAMRELGLEPHVGAPASGVSEDGSGVILR